MTDHRRSTPAPARPTVYSPWLPARADAHDYCAALIAIVSVLSIVAAIASTAVTIDEYAHVPAGLSVLERRTFRMYYENPPLIRCLTALPVWLAGAETDYRSDNTAPGSRSEWIVGRDFQWRNSSRYLALYARARIVVACLSLCCAVVIYVWARALHGRWAAIACLSLWCLDPNVLAHSALATVDIGATAIACAATGCFWRFLIRPTWGRAILAGVGLGVAQVSKFSLLVLYPAWLFMFVISPPRAARDCAEEETTQQPATKCFAIISLSIIIINASYLFSGSFASLASYDFRSRLLSRMADSSVPRRNDSGDATRSWLRRVPVPLPRAYLEGLDSQKCDEELGLMNLDDGQIVRGGYWYSPFRTMFYKLPAGTLLLVACWGISAIAGHLRFRRDDVAVLIPGVLVVALLCTQTGLNWAMRYALPALPFLFISLGRFIRAASNRRGGVVLVAGCLAFNVVSVFSSLPDHLSYVNELAGSRRSAQRMFLASNYDWGQDLLRLKAWCTTHEYVNPLRLAYYGTMDPAALGLNVAGVPPEILTAETGARLGDLNPNRSGYFIAVSATYLNGLPGPFRLDDGRTAVGIVALPPSCRREHPFARIGRTIFVFKVEPRASDRASLPTVPRIAAITSADADRREGGASQGAQAETPRAHLD